MESGRKVKRERGGHRRGGGTVKQISREVSHGTKYESAVDLHRACLETPADALMSRRNPHRGASCSTFKS